MKKTREQLTADRDEIANQMKVALVKPDMRKFNKLNTKYQKLSDKIRNMKDGN